MPLAADGFTHRSRYREGDTSHCRTKGRFPSRAKALREIRRIRALGAGGREGATRRDVRADQNDVLEPYWCARHACWHVGHGRL